MHFCTALAHHPPGHVRRSSTQRKRSSFDTNKKLRSGLLALLLGARTLLGAPGIATNGAFLLLVQWTNVTRPTADRGASKHQSTRTSQRGLCHGPAIEKLHAKLQITAVSQIAWFGSSISIPFFSMNAISGPGSEHQQQVLFFRVDGSKSHVFQGSLSKIVFSCPDLVWGVGLKRPPQNIPAGGEHSQCMKEY